MLQLKPLFSPPIALTLEYDPNLLPCETRDAAGYYCMAFLSHNAGQDWEQMKVRGFAVTSLDTLQLPGETIKLFFVLGPQNELVEIYQVKKQAE